MMRLNYSTKAILLTALSLLLILCSACNFSSPRPLVTPSPGLKTSETADLKPTPTEPPSLPRFEPGACRFTLPSSHVQCGDLIVLEDRRKPEGSTVTLHVAVFSSFNSNPEPDPVIYLMGGGGGDALGAAGFYLDAAGNRIRDNRDFILYNQRGTKRNEPYLSCPGEAEFKQNLNGVVHTKNEADQLEYDFLLGCRDHLLAQGVDLEMYSSVTHAADLIDLIRTLGYDQVNLYGTSYGTRLGLTVMRYYPEVVRSAILDAVLPPQVDFPSDAITSFVVSVENLFAACSAQEKCGEKYPDLEGDFYAVIEELKAEPAVVDIDGDEVVLDHILFLDAVYMLLHPASALAEIPRTIHSASQGEYSWLYDPIRSIRSYSDFVATGVSYSSLCKDEVRFDSLENSRAVLAQYPEGWHDYYELSSYFNICEAWVKEDADPEENEPVVSDIPALVLAGHFDSITSPAWCEETASYLENSFYYEFPNMAHGVLRYDDCALGMGLAFLDDPWTEPDVICMAELEHPKFR